MKFLPIKEFEKRQKSIDQYQDRDRAIMSSISTKIGFSVDASSAIDSNFTKLPS